MRQAVKTWGPPVHGMIGRMPCRSANVLLGLVLLAATGCNRETPASAAQSKALPAARSVRVVTASQESVPRTVIVSGTLAAEDQVVLGAKVAGRLAELAIDLGSRVQKGQVVARIDPGDYRMRVDQAVAALQQARARLGLRPDGIDDHVDPEQTAALIAAAIMGAEIQHYQDPGEVDLRRVLDTLVVQLGDWLMPRTHVVASAGGITA